ncbi:MAG: M15 family metallopeptidase [Propionibacteriales bacterium]|nr:M15 family metallopeptidase [Propionibacteriales bacterium]
MTYANPSPPRRTTVRAARTTAGPASRAVAVGLLVLAAGIAVPLSQRVLGSSSSTVGTPFDVFFGDDRGSLGKDGGVVPDGVSVFDDDYPAVARLDDDLLHALREADDDAAAVGIQLEVNSGWRSEAYQEQLLDEAVDQYGSREEAARWVATPETSAHVSGAAVDLAPQGAAWLSDHGASYGLCQTYRNEPWHFELRPEASVLGCPRPYDDPTQDPRMQS